jgi:hypothetical protein
MFRTYLAGGIYAVMILLAVIPAVFFFARLNDQAFLDSTMGNWFATMIGVVLGIPIALGLSRWQQRQQEQQERTARARETADHRTRVLHVIKNELQFNLERLATSRKGNGERKGKVTYARGLKTAMWQALSHGGELQWIGNPELLEACSLAYYYAEYILTLEGFCMQIVFYPGEESRFQEATMHNLIDLLVAADESAFLATKEALAAIGHDTSGPAM